MLLLSACRNNYSISLELIDDIAIIDEKENIIYREQDKNTIKPNFDTFSDRSKDIWNTFYIWGKDIELNKINPSKTKLICATNIELKEDSLLKKILDLKNNDKIKEAIDLLRKAAIKPSESIKKQSEYLLQREEVLIQIISSLELSDNNNNNNLNSEIIENLNIAPINAQAIVEELMGWVYNRIRDLLEKNQSAIIKVSDFKKRFYAIANAYENEKISLLGKKNVLHSISQSEKDESKNAIFVRQLELMIHPNKSDIILKAIEDYLYCHTETTRLADQGDITKADLSIMDEDNFERWKEIFDKFIVDLDLIKDNDNELGKMGFKIYNGTQEDYLVNITGLKINRDFTRGSLHKLANIPKIGWHPFWKKLIIENGKNN